MVGRAQVPGGYAKGIMQTVTGWRQWEIRPQRTEVHWVSWHGSRLEESRRYRSGRGETRRGKGTRFTYMIKIMMRKLILSYMQQARQHPEGNKTLQRSGADAQWYSLTSSAGVSRSAEFGMAFVSRHLIQLLTVRRETKRKYWSRTCPFKSLKSLG